MPMKMTVQQLIQQLQTLDPELPVGNDDAEPLDYVSTESYSDDSGWHDYVELRFEE